MDMRMVGLLAGMYQPQQPDEAAPGVGARQAARVALALVVGTAMALAPLAFWVVLFRGR